MPLCPSPARDDRRQLGLLVGLNRLNLRQWLNLLNLLICWKGTGWACAVAMAVTSAASVNITSAVMTRAAAECQWLGDSEVYNSVGLCW